MPEPTEPNQDSSDGDQTDESDESLHLKFNRDVLPDFKRRPEVWDDGKQALRDDVDTLEETDSFFKWGGVAVLLVVVAAIIGVSLRKAKDKPDEQGQVQLSPSEVYERERKVVSELVTSYLASSTVEERLEFVRRKEVVQPLMEIYHEENGIYGLKVWDTEKVEPRWSFGGRPFWEVVVNTPEGKETLIVEQDATVFKVDWETHVGLNPMSPEKYVEERPVEEMDFRVYATPDDYFNGAFADPNEFLVARIEFPNSNQVVFGYMEKSSPDIGHFRQLVDGQRDVKLILKLQWPEGAGGKNSLPQLHIRELVIDRWLLDE